MTQVDKLSAARQKLKESGKSPVALGKAAKLLVLTWIYLWGFSSAFVLLALLSRTSGGYAQRLVRQGLLVETKTASGTPKYFYTLSEAGLRLAEKNTLRQVPYPELNPQRVNQRLIGHDLVVQLETLSAMQDGWVVDFETEKSLRLKGDKAGIKRPDAAWNVKGDFRVGVEVELSPKWERDLDKFIQDLIFALDYESNRQAAYDRIVIIFDSARSLERYKEAMKPSSTYRVWVKDHRNYWAVERVVQVPAWLTDRVEFRMVGQKE